jgi:hypothetical protein
VAAGSGGTNFYATAGGDLQPNAKFAVSASGDIQLYDAVALSGLTTPRTVTLTFTTTGGSILIGALGVLTPTSIVTFFTNHTAPLSVPLINITSALGGVMRFDGTCACNRLISWNASAPDAFGQLTASPTLEFRGATNGRWT